jgi:hypothetical protein
VTVVHRRSASSVLNERRDGGHDRARCTRLRCHPKTQDYIARKRPDGKSTKEAIRCLKRHLTRRLWHLLQPPNARKRTPIHLLK